MKSQMGVSDLLFVLQKQQFQHDENFHREIARLPVARRLTHMALHISKYFSRIVREHDDASAAKKAWLDTFIISTSIANILNQRLSDLWGITDSNLHEVQLKRWLATRYETNKSPLFEYAQINDTLSSACEKLDHLEDFKYRPTIAECAGKLSQLSANEVIEQYGNLHDAVTDRLLETKKKNIFFGG